MDKALVAWAKQHIEWTLADGGALHPDGVLMLIVDESGRAAMTVGPHEPLACRLASVLIERARESWHEGLVTGVSPESIWIVSEGTLVVRTVVVRELSTALTSPVKRMQPVSRPLLHFRLLAVIDPGVFFLELLQPPGLREDAAPFARVEGVALGADADEIKYIAP